jgi:hypothetical protein
MTEIIAPILAALATAIGGTLVAWFSARMRPGRFERTVEQVNKLADYVTSTRNHSWVIRRFLNRRW